MSSWYTTHAPEDDIAVSTRIRLARNLSGLPFPARMTPEQHRELNLKVKNAVLQSNNISIWRTFRKPKLRQWSSVT